MSSPFNEEKYKQLLEGLEISEVSYKQVIDENDWHRFDPEYYRKQATRIINAIKKKKYCTIGECFDVSKLAGFEFTEYFTSENMQSIDCYIALTSKNIQNERLDLSDYITIDKSVADLNLSRSKIFDNDVILSYTGEYRRALTLQENRSFQLGPNICRLRPKGQIINPFYLSTFLNSKIGQIILDKEKTLSAQPTVAMSRIRLIPIPISSFDFQQEIELIIKSAHDNLSKSKSLYSEAENLLLTELGLKGWQPDNNPVNIKQLKESYLKSGRLDAEHYMVKYDELEVWIKSVSHKTIAEIQLFNARGVQPVYIQNGEVPIVNSKHILEDGLDYDNFEHTTTDFLNSHNRARIVFGDILIYTTGANIGRTQVYLKDEPAVASNHVNILRVQGVNPIYLAVVLNSQVGRMQTEKLCTGSAQAELYPDDIEKFIVPILPEKKQKTIADYVQKSISLRNEAKQLLESAKLKVEDAISTPPPPSLFNW